MPIGNTIKAIVCDESHHDVPENLKDFTCWLSEKTAAIPDEFKDSAEIRFCDNYGEVYIDISYLRPMSPEDIEAHKKKEIEFVQDQVWATERKLVELNQRLGELK